MSKITEIFNIEVGKKYQIKNELGTIDKSCYYMIEEYSAELIYCYPCSKKSEKQIRLISNIILLNLLSGDFTFVEKDNSIPAIETMFSALGIEKDVMYLVTGISKEEIDEEFEHDKVMIMLNGRNSMLYGFYFYQNTIAIKEVTIVCDAFLSKIIYGIATEDYTLEIASNDLKESLGFDETIWKEKHK